VFWLTVDNAVNPEVIKILVVESDSPKHNDKIVIDVHDVPESGPRIRVNQYGRFYCLLEMSPLKGYWIE
jgi:hypothetical protein